MIRLRFLQLSDLHFGAPMTHSKLGLPPEKALQRRQEFEDLIRSLPKLVMEHQVDVLLMPGDLWDHERLDLQNAQTRAQFALLYDVLCRIPVPVAIAPGNHDFYSPSSLYHPNTLQALHLVPWPAHVLIFRQAAFQTMDLPGWEGRVRITGSAFQDNLEYAGDAGYRYQRPLSALAPRNPSDPVELLVFHGARDDALYCEEKLMAPFSLEELLEKQFDYAAVGHYHRCDIFTTPFGMIKGAYAGAPFARGLDETGPKYALLGEIVKEGQSPATVTLEKLALDAREIVACTISLLRAESVEAIQSQVLAELNYAAKSQDIVYCKLQGQIMAGVEVPWATLEALLNQVFFHVTLDTREVQPTYDVNTLRQDPYRLAGRYIQAIEQELASTANDAQKALLEKALFLGLEALHGNPVKLR